MPTPAQSDIGRVEDALADGRLLHPIDPSTPSTVDLALAVHAWGGAPVRLTPHARTLQRTIAGDAGDPQHLVFVLADGLGCNILDRLPTTDAFPAHTAAELRAVFPSTTATALTSLGTAAWPAQHAVPGWFTRLPDHGRTAIILPYVERGTATSLIDLGVDPASAFPLPSQFRHMTVDVHTYHPEVIAGSVYTAYQRGDATGEGYETLAQACESITGWIAAAHAPTFHYLYIPDVDQAEHAHGFDSDAALDALTRVQRQIAALADALAAYPGVRVVVSTDHGMLNMPRERKHVVAAGDPLLDDLVAPFAGEPRVPMFHVRPGRHAPFAAAFRERFGHAFALLTTDDVNALHLFGPDRLSPTARARLGDFVAIGLEPDVLCYEPDGTAPLRGFHAGLTPGEMRIPCIVFGA